jgi:hypothetical protein
MGRHTLGRGLVCHQHLRRPRVQARATPPAKRFVHRLAHDRMHKPQRTAPIQHVRPGKRIRGRTDLLMRKAAQRRDLPNLGVRVEHRHRVHYRPRNRREPPEPQRHRASHSLRPQPGHQLRRASIRCQPIGPQRVDQLAQQKRIAPGRPHTRRHQAPVGHVPEALRHQPPRRIEAERPQPHRPRPRPRTQRRQQPGRLALPRLGRPRRHHHRNRQALQPGRQIVQEPQRQPVRPVRIIDEQLQPLPLGQIRRQPIQRMHDRKRRIGRRPTPIRRRLDPDRHRSKRRRTSQQPAALIARRRAHHPFEQLAHHAEAKPALQLLPTPPQHTHTVRPRPSPSRLQQARLADPSMSLDKHQRPRPGRNRCQLGLAPEQRPPAPRRRQAHASPARPTIAAAWSVE